MEKLSLKIYNWNLWRTRKCLLLSTLILNYDRSSQLNAICLNRIRVEKTKNEKEKSLKLMRRVIYLAVTFSSLIGGTGTLTGTTTNLIFKGMTAEWVSHTPMASNWFIWFSLVDDNITFANWMMYSIPGLIVSALFVWLFMIAVFARKFPKYVIHSNI